jgi:hypothetical protein
MNNDNANDTLWSSPKEGELEVAYSESPDSQPISKTGIIRGRRERTSSTTSVETIRPRGKISEIAIAGLSSLKMMKDKLTMPPSHPHTRGFDPDRDAAKVATAVSSLDGVPRGRRMGSRQTAEVETTVSSDMKPDRDAGCRKSATVPRLEWAAQGNASTLANKAADVKKNIEEGIRISPADLDLSITFHDGDSKSPDCAVWDLDDGCVCVFPVYHTLID